jgi:hypothetical protein
LTTPSCRNSSWNSSIDANLLNDDELKQPFQNQFSSLVCHFCNYYDSCTFERFLTSP